MTLLEESKDTFVRLFEELDRKRQPKLYEMQRRLGRGLFADLSFPNESTEDWRFTSIAPLLRLPLALADGAPTAEGVDLPAPCRDDAIRLVFVDGVFIASASRLAPKAAGAAIGYLSNPPPEHLRQIESLLGQVAEPSDQVFTALNAGMLHDGAYVLIPQGTALESPVEIIYATLGGETPIATHPRTLIYAARNSQVTVVERFVGPARDSQSYLTNAVTECVLEQGAVVEHYKIQVEGRAAYHLANTQVVQKRGSNFSSHYVSLGGLVVRNETRVRFEGEGCTATVNGLYVAAGKQHMDNFTVIDHAQPHCESHELYKGVLDGQAHGVFNGKIFVREDAQKTDAKQTNKVLLLSDGAVINTKPQLEIFADDVKCTHGATVGQIDETQLFYLRSRGIPKDEARRILTFAFANDVVSRIKIERLREELEEVLVGRSERGGA